jgi:hypothetical protein
METQWYIWYKTDNYITYMYKHYVDLSRNVEFPNLPTGDLNFNVQGDGDDKSLEFLVPSWANPCPIVPRAEVALAASFSLPR